LTGSLKIDVSLEKRLIPRLKYKDKFGAFSCISVRTKMRKYSRIMRKKQQQDMGVN
jgi:hypothetical protein